MNNTSINSSLDQFVPAGNTIKNAYVWNGAVEAFLMIKGEVVLLKDCYVFGLECRGKTKTIDLRANTELIRKIGIGRIEYIRSTQDVLGNITKISYGQASIHGIPTVKKPAQKLLGGGVPNKSEYHILNDFINALDGDTATKAHGLMMPDEDERKGFQFVANGKRHFYILDVSDNLLKQGDINIFGRVGSKLYMQSYKKYDDGSRPHAVLANKAWRPHGMFVECKFDKTNEFNPFPIVNAMKIVEGDLLEIRINGFVCENMNKLNEIMIRLTTNEYMTEIIEQVHKITRKFKEDKVYSATDGETRTHQPLGSFTDKEVQEGGYEEEWLYGGARQFQNEFKGRDVGQQLIAQMQGFNQSNRYANAFKGGDMSVDL